MKNTINSSYHIAYHAICRILMTLMVTALGLSSLAMADTINITNDAHIDLGSPADNVGTVPNLAVSNIVSKRSGEKLTFVSYDLLPLPAGAQLEQAILRLFVGKVHTEGLIDLYLVTELWEEHTISGLNDPAIDAAPFTDFVLTQADEGHFVLIDVTPEVAAWLDGSADNYGFALLGNPAGEVDVVFDSKENSQSSQPSELELFLGVAEGGVDSDDIADGSVTSDDIADNSVTGTDILDGSIGALDIDKDEIQLRVNGSCAAGSSIRVIDNMGAVICETDDDSGDITSVHPAPGSGLEGGADSGDAVLGIATGGVTSAMIANGAVNSTDVDNSSVQLRVGGSCTAGSSIRVIASDGSVTCQSDGNSGGDITAVQTPPGSGLAGGVDSGDAVLGVAADGIISAMIADGSILGSDVNDTEIQLRVDAACPPGSSIRAINSNGSAICEVDDYEADTDTTLDPNEFWGITGNGGTNPIPGGSNFLGTTDSKALVLGANGEQAMRLEFIPHVSGDSVNVLGGHSSNKIINARGATIGGGGLVGLPNKVEASFGTVSGGFNNGVLGEQGTIGGGRNNFVLGTDGTVGGGIGNWVEATAATVSGGYENTAHRAWSTIGGGYSNSICDPAYFDPDEYDANDGSSAVIAGGSGNRSCGSRAFIGGGFANSTTGGSSMVIGGAWNRAAGRYSLAAGHFSSALEDWSVALGHHAKALHQGAFVWSDTYSISDFESQRDNQFRIGAVGGARFDLGDDNGSIPAGNQWVDLRAQGSNTLGNNPNDFRIIDTSTGAYLSIGGGWVSSSDRNRKADFVDVDVQAVLQQVVSIPIQSWRYKVEDERVRHIGPMAQDFHAVFGFGGNPKGIMTVDADGVALAAIQALYQVTRELEQRTLELEAQSSRISALEAAFAELKYQLAPNASEPRLTGLSN